VTLEDAFKVWFRRIHKPPRQMKEMLWQAFSAGSCYAALLEHNLICDECGKSIKEHGPNLECPDAVSVQ